jgi:signal transduction histidine kinase
VRVEYAAPGFGSGDNVRYRYRLEGFDDDWSEWTAETRKEYTNLPPGRFTFVVEAHHPQVWTAAPASYSFHVLPPWYRTTGAYMLYGLLFVGLIVGVVQWRTAHLGRRKEWLERVVAQRTAEVKEQARQLEAYNDELLRSNEELQVAVEEKSKLLGVAAHDLKNPLFGIRALAEVLLDRANLTDNVSRKLNLIRQSADETLRLINNLLASAASSGQSRLDRETIDVAAMAEWITHGFQPQAERKDQQLHCSIPSTPCVVEGDKRKVREAMNNLISNAIKYSPHGAPIYVEVDRSSDEVLFHVRDEGPGLSEEDQQRMFAAFQRLTPSPTGDEGSSGLGLYIVKRIVELHGGEVLVDSELGGGSTFTIVLPIASSEGTVPPAEAATGGNDLLSDSVRREKGEMA